MDSSSSKAQWARHLAGAVDGVRLHRLPEPLHNRVHRHDHVHRLHLRRNLEEVLQEVLQNRRQLCFHAARLVEGLHKRAEAVDGLHLHRQLAAWCAHGRGRRTRGGTASRRCAAAGRSTRAILRAMQLNERVQGVREVTVVGRLQCHGAGALKRLDLPHRWAPHTHQEA